MCQHSAPNVPDIKIKFFATKKLDNLSSLIFTFFLWYCISYNIV